MNASYAYSGQYYITVDFNARNEKFLRLNRREQNTNVHQLQIVRALQTSYLNVIHKLFFYGFSFSIMIKILILVDTVVKFIRLSAEQPCNFIRETLSREIFSISLKARIKHKTSFSYRTFSCTVFVLCNNSEII